MIFSTSTIASSTIIPITNARANRVRVSRLNPAIAITTKVPKSDRGIAIAAIKVARQLRKNPKIVNTEINIAPNKASMVAWVASLI